MQAIRLVTQVTLYQTFVAPAASGKLRQEIRLPVEAGFRTVCARAELIGHNGRSSPMPCPLQGDGDSGVLELRVPSSK